jgi:NitT/TauT family transport system substrate-binding protein
MRLAVVAGLLVALFARPFPAAAADALTVVTGAAPNGIYEAFDRVAQGAGFFKQQHLDVTYQYSGSAFTAAQLVASGKADITTSSVEPILTGYEKGIRLQLFLSRAARYSYVLAVLADSPIRTLADFKGKDIGEINIGSAAEIATASMLAGAGLRKGDYSYVPIGTGLQAMSAIVERRVAAAAFPYIELSTFEVIGDVRFRFFRHPILADIANVGYAAAPATIQAKSDALRRFCRAIVMAAILVRENPEASARLFLQTTGTKFDEAAVQLKAHQLELLVDDLPGVDPTSMNIGYLSPQGIEFYSRFLANAGLTHEVVPGSAVVTNQFIVYANDFDHQAMIAYAKKAR